MDALTQAPINVVPHGDRQRPSATLFNSTYLLAAGAKALKQRGNNLPIEDLSRYLDRLYRSELSPNTYYGVWMADGGMKYSDPPPMLAMALTTSKASMHDLLGPKNLVLITL